MCHVLYVWLVNFLLSDSFLQVSPIFHCMLLAAWFFINTVRRYKKIIPWEDTPNYTKIKALEDKHIIHLKVRRSWEDVALKDNNCQLRLWYPARLSVIIEGKNQISPLQRWTKWIYIIKSDYIKYSNDFFYLKRKLKLPMKSWIKVNYIRIIIKRR